MKNNERILNRINSNLLEITIVFALYLAFVVPLYYFPSFKSSQITYYLFLPAGIKLFSILIFQWRGLIGVTLGTFTRLMIADPAQPIVTWFIVAAAVNLAIYLVIKVGLWLMKTNEDLSNLHYYQVVLLAVVTSIINGSIFAYTVGATTIGQYGDALFHNGLMNALGNFAGNAFIACLLLFISHRRSLIRQFINSKIDLE
jgi:hypothetical protein